MPPLKVLQAPLYYCSLVMSVCLDIICWSGLVDLRGTCVHFNGDRVPHQVIQRSCSGGKGESTKR